MALVVAARNIYTPGTGTASVTIDGGGSDKLIAVIAANRGNTTASCSTVVLNGVTGTVFTQKSVDGGTAANVAICYFDDGENPGAGTFDLYTSWDKSTNNQIYEVIEFTGADQTTPMNSATFAVATDLADGGTIDVTLASQQDERAFTFVATGDAVSGSGGNHAVDADATEINEDFTGRCRTAVAEDTIVASSSVTYTWTVSHNGTDIADSVVAGVFAVFAAASGGLENTVTATLGTIEQIGSNITLGLFHTAYPSLGSSNVNGLTPEESVFLGLVPSVGGIEIGGLTPDEGVIVGLTSALGEVNVGGLTPEAVAGIAAQIGNVDVTGTTPRVGLAVTSSPGEIELVGLTPTVDFTTTTALSPSSGSVELVGITAFTEISIVPLVSSVTAFGLEPDSEISGGEIPIEPTAVAGVSFSSNLITVDTNAGFWRKDRTETLVWTRIS